MALKSHESKAIAFAKWSFWVQNCSTITLMLFCAKNGSKKKLKFKKNDSFSKMA